MLTRRQFSKLIVGPGLLASGNLGRASAATIRGGRLYVNRSEDFANI
jgi:hypothetical protein